MLFFLNVFQKVLHQLWFLKWSTISFKADRFAYTSCWDKFSLFCLNLFYRIASWTVLIVSLPGLNGFESSSDYHKWRIHHLASNRQSLVDSRWSLSKKWFDVVQMSTPSKVLEFPCRIRPSTKGCIAHLECMLDPETDRRFAPTGLWYRSEKVFIYLFIYSFNSSRVH